MNLAEASKIFKALDDEKRLMILQLLVDGEKCACVLLDKLDFTQSGLSYQMKILCDSGLVRGRKDGKWVHYSINREACKDAADLLLKLTGAHSVEQETSSPCKCSCNTKETV